MLNQKKAISNSKWREKLEKGLINSDPWLNAPIYKSSYPNSKSEGAVYVNLEYTDEILIEHFKKWLSSIRAEKRRQMSSKYYRQNDFNDWVKYGVLPYLDLKGWELENNLQIPNRVMADAIYPQGEGGEETVRKTTQALIKNLLSQKSISQLAGQITLEISEYKSK